MIKQNFDILRVLEEQGFKAYVVGGFVRDYLMKRETTDIDICTNAKPKDLIKIFNADVSKEKYGSVVVYYKNIRYEITSFRKELRYENRKPVEFEYTDLLEEDLVRRDFTINAMCMDKDCNITDLYGGKKDIDLRILRCIGDANIKFREDPLRMLRAIRFATTLNFKLDDSIIHAIMENGYLLKHISYDRKKSELSKIFASVNVKRGIKLLYSFKLDTVLEINNLDRIKLCKDILGIWTQLDVKDTYPFTKNELEIINDVDTMVRNKTISKYEIYKYGLYKSTIAAEILGINKNIIVKLDRGLKIHKRSDIDITALELKDILNKKDGKWISDIYSNLEMEIIYGKIKNNKKDIIDYVVKNY
jgi:tRNA nucleotidyltransferase (CCA-adding enzyme)